MTISEREELFREPTAAYRGKPFWAWNGKLEEEEILRQVDVMKEMGFGGYFMHSRTGLATEYLGDEWFRITNACADYGEKQGMESWLYDEDRWPSGSAGGIVTKEEKYRSMYLEMRLFSQEDWEKQAADRFGDPATAAVFAVGQKDGIYSSFRPLNRGEALFPGETAAWFYTRYSVPNDNYNGSTYLNTMSLEATEAYIESTHEAYRKRCGDRLGKSIPGIFTDEPHRGGTFSSFSDGGERAVPYTPDLFEEFEKRFGYPLKENLPALFLRSKAGEVSPIKRDYYELCEELFLERYAAPIHEWCQKNRMRYTGHVLHEDSLTAQTVMQGSLMRYYEHMDVPGVDCLTEHNTCYWIVKQIASAARQLGQPWILSELYGCTGWQMNFESYKNVGDWQALFGVNLRCPHLSWYTMKGEAKRDYPASILHQSAWYQDFRAVEDYFSRIHAALHEGTPVCHVLVLNPIESVWARAYSGAFDGLSARDPEIVRLERQYAAVFHALTDNRIDFDYADEDIFARHASVLENGTIRVGEAVYTKLLVAGADTIRSSTLELLKTFREAGGELIFAGDAPTYLDARVSDEVLALAAGSVRIPFDADAIADACRSGDEIGVSASPENGKIYAQSFTVPGGRMTMLLNMDRKNALSCEIDLGEGLTAERWDPRTGAITRPDFRRERGHIVLSLNLERGGERLYLVTDNERNLPDETPFVPNGRMTLPEEWRYRLTEKNVCVLDRAEARSEKHGAIEKSEVLFADRKLRDLLGLSHRGGEMLQPWYQIKYFGGDTEILDRVTVTHRFGVEVPPRGASLVLEGLDTVDSIRVNGHDIPLVSAGKWVDICYDILPIPDECFVTGENRIEIVMRYYRTSGLEASFLIGDFGVRVVGDSAALTALPETLRIGDLVPQGLPFYSGGVIYELPAECRTGGVSRVTADGFGGALVKLRGEKTVPLPFPPFTGEVKGLLEIEVVLTRRNTFGPLHEVPKRAWAYGPGNFLTGGEHWNDAYQLFETGLLAEPVIEA